MSNPPTTTRHKRKMPSPSTSSSSLTMMNQPPQPPPPPPHHVHSFFAPRTKKTHPKKITSTPTKPATSTTNTTTNTTTTTTVATTRTKKPPTKPKKTGMIDSLEETAVVVASLFLGPGGGCGGGGGGTTHPPTSSSTSNQSNNSSSALQRLMAEQKRAEFQADRRLQRQKEIHRQQQRMMIQQQHRTATAAETVTAHHPSSSNQGHIPTTTTTTHRGLLPLPLHCRLPLAPRFPYPSHVGTLVPPQQPHPHPTFNHCATLFLRTTTMTTTTTTKPAELPSHPTTIPTTTTLLWGTEVGPVHPPRDLLQHVLSRTLRPVIHPTTTTKTNINNNNNILWSQKYGPAHNGSRSTSGGGGGGSGSGIHNLVGTSTVQAARILSQWIQSWCTTRQQALDRMKERHRHLSKQYNHNKNHNKNKNKSKTKNKKPKRKTHNNDDDSDDDCYVYDTDEFDDDSGRGGEGGGLSNVYLVTGPPASGKTALAHAVAKHCHCSIVEINTTVASRSGSALKHSIQEATQSCSTLHMFQQQQQQQTANKTKTLPCIFQPRQQQERASSSMIQTLSDTDDDDDDEAEDDDIENDKMAKKRASLTVILIDEVDLIYETEGDAGFWSALASVAKTARCPILLTANTIPAGLANIKYSHLELERPTPMDCATKILQVCQQENLSIIPSLEATMVHDRLASMASAYQCDLRKLLNHLQLFAAPVAAATAAAATTSRPASSRDDHRSTLVPSTSPVQGGRPTTPLATTKDLTWPSPSLPCEARALRPVVQSIVPHRVPFDKYTVVTVHGSGFSMFMGDDGLTVRLGDDTKTCRAHVADDERLLFLCPPYRGDHYHEEGHRPSNRVRSVVLCSRRFGEEDTAQVQQMVLFDRGSLPVVRRLCVEYLFPEKEEMDDSEEHEFDNNDAEQGGRTSSEPQSSCPPAELGPIELLELWEKTIAEEKTARSNIHHPQPTGPNHDDSTIQDVEDMAKAYEYSSDAAFLEDFQYGIPHLSGACRGFGFELTEEGSGFVHNHGHKLRLNENSRPYVFRVSCDAGSSLEPSFSPLAFSFVFSPHQSL